MDAGDPALETAMNTALRLAIGSAAALVGIACADTGPSSAIPGSVASFATVPAGFSSVTSSFDASGDLDGPFLPHLGDGSFDDHGKRGPGLGDDHGRKDDHGRDGRGPGREFFFRELMGGGIGPDFLGVFAFGPGKGRGPFQRDTVGSSCVFASSTGIVTCGPVTRKGLTVLVTAKIETADGTAQAKPDSLTNSLTLHSEVTGTVTRKDSATSTIDAKSDRKVTGLAKGSTQRTVDGTAVGTETTNGTTDDGAFTATRTVADTTAGIIIPIADGRPTYPTAGRVSRNMTSSVKIGGSTTNHARSEIVTFDGSATAKIVITQDGVTKNCTFPLPKGKLVCE